MKNIVEFSDGQKVAEEAARWILKLESDEGLSNLEKDRLRAWLDKSAVHREHFERLVKVWGGANILTELAVPLHGVKSRDNPSFARARMAIAASVIFVVGMVSLFMFDTQMPVQENRVVATEVGNQKTLDLADGSVLQLNTNSKIRIDYSKDFRDIYLLSGEAYFSVAKDKTRPFRVYAGSGRIRAIGTAFSVYLKDNKVDVAVSEGRVGVASVPIVSSSIRSPKVVSRSARSLGMLRAGEVGSIVSQLDENSKSVQTLEKLEEATDTDVAKRVSWTEGILIFAGEPLEQVVEEISRYTDVSIEFASPEIRTIRIGGNFPVGETETMFSSLETNFGLQVARLDNNRVVIHGGKSFD